MKYLIVLDMSETATKNKNMNRNLPTEYTENQRNK